ncbi:MAG: SMC-Scp complex subunit ScpB [Brevinematales bacterium]|nr:SMC-Scp complex subunit ScpB [Brevinematales bacterium]
MNNSLFINKTYSRNEIKGLIEGILFVRGKPVTYKELIQILEINKDDINKLIEEMNNEYKENKHGFFIINVADGLQLVSNPHYKDELEELFGKKNEFQIPKSALETLAIIAYKQPVTKEEIDGIRGVSSTRSINHLLSLKLITISGTHKELNLPVYSTTERFLEVFRLKDLSDLPAINTIDFNALDDIEDEEEEVEEKADEVENLI